jgi:hypothetical protein
MLTIGVTGHRFLTEVDKLQAGIDQGLARIDTHYPGQAWSVVSSLAEGADRLVVERVFAYQPTARLVVPLPLPVEEYQADFSSTGSRDEFERWLALASEVAQLPATASRDAAYRAAAEYILKRSSVLIALWDGLEAQGRGGTGEVVAIARERGLPLVWVQCGNRQPGTNKPTQLGGRQGKIIFERF